MEKSDLNKLIKIVDDFVTQLKKDLLIVQYKSTTTGVVPGVWDKMKKWWHNTVMGANNPDNPYVYKNKFGALGHEDAKTESKRLTLSQYSFIKEQYNKLENDLSVINEDLETESENLKKLKLFRIIDSWATKFKQEIIKQFSDTAVDATTAGADAAVTPAVDADTADDADIAAADVAAVAPDTTAPIQNTPTKTAAATGTANRKKTPIKPPRVSTKISWSRDKGWGPRLEGVKELHKSLPIKSINRIKKVVFLKLNKKKEDIPNFEETFEKDFEVAFKSILDGDENIFKNNPELVSKIENSTYKYKWEQYLAHQVAEKLHVKLAARMVGLETEE